MHPNHARAVRYVLVAAVCSAMEAAATCLLCWAVGGYGRTRDQGYVVPMIVYGTVWLLTTVFVAGVSWEGARAAVRTATVSRRGRGVVWTRSPKPPKPPTPPPSQPGDQHRPKPSPIQPRPPKPPKREHPTETTLVDMEPISDATMEIPVVDVLAHWRPPVSNSARQN